MDFGDLLSAVGVIFGLAFVILIWQELIKSRKMLNYSAITFDHLVGHHLLKTRLTEIIDLLKKPVDRPVHLPKLLISGDSETGKTTWAEAIAGTAKVPFFRLTREEALRCDPSTVERIFEEARRNQPALVIFDDIDVFVDNDGEEAALMRQALYSVCQEVSSSDRILLVAIMGGSLDPNHRLVAPGNFDCVIRLDVPHYALRREFLRKRIGQLFREAGRADNQELNTLDFNLLAQLTWNHSFSFLERLIGHVISRLERIQRLPLLRTFEDCLEELAMGVNLFDPDRLSPEGQKRIAVHEAGHAVVCYLCNPTFRMFRLRIDYFSTRCGGGYHFAVPPIDADCAFQTKTMIQYRVRHALGAWSAERLIYDETADGVGMDLQHATQRVRDMVMLLGMSERLGPVYLPEGREDIAKDAILEMIEQETAWVQEVFNRNRPMLQAVIDQLFVGGSLNHEQFMKIVSEFPINLPEKEA